MDWSRIESLARRVRLPLALALVAYALSPLAMVGYFYLEAMAPQRVTAVSRWEESLPGIDMRTEDFARMLQRPAPPAAAQWQPALLPTTVGHAPVVWAPNDAELRRVWYRFQYSRPAQMRPNEPIELHSARWIEGPWQVWANGQPLADSLSHWRMQWNRPLHARLPVTLSEQAGPIEIMVALAYRPRIGYTASSIFIGPQSALAPLAWWREFRQFTMPQISTAIVILMGLLSLQFWWRRREEKLHLLLALSAVAWWATNLQYQVAIPDHPELARWFTAISDSGTAWVMLLVFLFAFRLEGRRYPHIEALLLAYAIGVTVLKLPLWQWQADTVVLHHGLDALLSMLAACVVSWRALQTHRADLLFLGAAAWLCIGFGLHDVALVAQWLSPESIYLLPYGTLFLFAAFVYAVQRRYLAALHEVETINRGLEQRLAERQAELEEHHRRFKRIEQEQTLLIERQRLMREMHDGLGSSLMSSLTMVERGRLDAPGMAQLLRECIDDLRLIVDSMEPVDRDLVTLLGALRYRIGRRIEAAGIRIEWVIDDIPPLPWLDPSAALQVLRIVQEALTNVLKYASATRVRIQIRSGADAVQVLIADDGVGFDVAACEQALQSPAGRRRGLFNMRSRAAALGGSIVWRREAGETQVVLSLPVTATREAIA